MAPVVQKYGSLPVNDVDVMRRITRRIVATREAGSTVVAVISAMGDTTDELLDQIVTLITDAPTHEMDTLLSVDERISVTLLTMAISELGIPARAYTGIQAGVLTDSKYSKTSIVDVLPKCMARSIQTGSVIIAAGFQGINEVEDTTTLGRGGSDTTVVALAAALDVDVCEVYTGVDGLFTADPRIVPTAKRIESFSSEKALELVAHGAKILHLRVVKYARRFGVSLHVRSSFFDKTGAWIYGGRRKGAFVLLVVAAQPDDVVAADADSSSNTPSITSPAAPQFTGATPTSPSDPARLDEGPSVSAADITHCSTIATRAQARPRPSTRESHAEAPVISGVTHDHNRDKIMLVGVSDVPGTATRIFAIVAGTDANIGMVVQDVSAEGMGLTNISFTCPDGDSVATREAPEAAHEKLGFRSLHFNPDTGTLSLVEAGIRSSPGASTHLFGSLSEARVNIHMIPTSEIRILAVADDAALDETARTVHSAFGFDIQATEAVVYGGTGRRAIS